MSWSWRGRSSRGDGRTRPCCCRPVASLPSPPVAGSLRGFAAELPVRRMDSASPRWQGAGWTCRYSAWLTSKRAKKMCSPSDGQRYMPSAPMTAAPTAANSHPSASVHSEPGLVISSSP